MWLKKMFTFTFIADVRTFVAVEMIMMKHHTTVNTGAEMRNVGHTAYAMSHAAVEACTVHTVAGCRGIGLQHPVYSPSAALAVVQPAECE